MRLLSPTNVGIVLGSALLVSTHSVDLAKDRAKRQYNYSNRQQQVNYGNSNHQQRQGYSNGGQQSQGQESSSNTNSQQYNSDYNSLLQQYAAMTSGSNSNAGYYDNYANSVSDYTADAYLPAATFSSATVSENADSSPALSALALLGFLYFLNLIQDVLQNNGRKKRSIDVERSDDESYYSTSYLEDPRIIPEELHLRRPVEEETDDDLQYLQAGSVDRHDRRVEKSPYAPRSFSFLENFFIKLPQFLGLTSNNDKQIERNGRDEKSMDVGNFITSRIKMISSIMSFLQDPRPSRIKRDMQTKPGSTLIDLLAEAASSFLYDNKDLETNRDGKSIQEKDQVDDGDTGIISRVKRFTHSMNVWYDELGGRNYEPTDKTSQMASKVTSMLGGSNTLQEAMKKDAVPTFLEFTKSLDGRHPHCLQRALCRMNTHTHGVSFLPKLAIQFFSNQMASASASDGLVKANHRAMAAGREGLNCAEEFPDCPNVGQ